MKNGPHQNKNVPYRMKKFNFIKGIKQDPYGV